MATSPGTAAELSAEDMAASLLDRPRSPGEEDGLEVSRWSVTDNEVLLRRSLARYALRDIPLGADAAELERHGFRAVVIAEDDLPKFLVDMGGTTKAMAVWFGQVPQWRELLRTGLESPRVAMIDGKADRLSPGWIRLMVRAWTVPLEEGAYLDVQVAPQLVSDTSEVPSLASRDTLRGRVWEAAVVHVELPRHTALLLVSAPAESPKWEEDPEGPPERPERPGSGPAAELPPTLGEYLLTDFEARPRRRLVAVLRARLPDILFAKPLPTDAATGESPPTSPSDGRLLDPPADAP